MTSGKETSEPQDLFNRVQAFRDKYSDLRNRVSMGLRQAEIKYGDLDAAEMLDKFYFALSANHPEKPIMTTGYPRYVVTTSRVNFDLHAQNILSGFVQDWLPAFREKLKEKIDAKHLESGELTPLEEGAMDTYVMMGKLIEGFKQDYLPLQKDLERYRKVLDKQKKQEKPVEDSFFTREVEKSRTRLKPTIEL